MSMITRHWWLFYPFLIVALLILIFEVPFREVRRAWHNMKIWRRYKDNLRMFREEWKRGPDA